VPELPLDHSERMLELGTDAGLEVFELLDQCIGLLASVQRAGRANLNTA
jgi:hypothetical protein